MDFLRLFQSLEEFLYEAMSWLVFYPRTLWRTIRHPIQMLRYSDKELEDAPDQQFTDMLSPPLFLMLTILLSHLIEVASHQKMPEVATTGLGKAITASEMNLLVLRAFLFAIYPLMFAVRRLKAQGLELNRDTLRRPFYAQCYIAGLTALVLGIASILARFNQAEVTIAALVVSLITIIWYLRIETIWLRSRTRKSTGKAFRSVLGTWLLASLINSAASYLILGG
ncbi:hypothetical protein ACFSUK_15695 [Sphingobium scionense]